MKDILKKNKKLVRLIVIIIVVMSAILFYLYYSHLKSNKLCGSDGELYYCESTEDVNCGAGNVAVRDGKGYNCISKDEYRHDFLGEEYDYACIQKFGKTSSDIDPNNYTGDGVQVNGNTIIISDYNLINKDLVKEEQQCLYNKISNEVSTMIGDMEKEIPNQFDIRSKVKIKAGNQGQSDTCVLWVITKALEISAQLKNLDYQFLLDFEKNINNTTYSQSGVADENGDIHFGLQYLVPGNKKNVWIQDFRTYYVNPEANITYYPKYSDSLLTNYEAYEKITDKKCVPNDGGMYCEPFFKDEYDTLNTYFIKQLIMNYGSAFIQTDPESKKFANGHMMIVIGWDDAKESWLVLNSWGDTWSDGELKSNGDGTTWIKYSNKDYVFWNDWYGNAIELISE